MADQASAGAVAWRFRAWVGCVIALLLTLAGLVASLAWLGVGVPVDGRVNATGLSAWWGASAVAWLVLTAIGCLLATTPMNARRLNIDNSIVILLGVAFATRLAVVAVSPPLLSDDIWRYVLDGQTLWSGDNPYAYAPAEQPVEAPGHAATETGDTSGEAAKPPAVNHPELVTIYQPTSQWMFAAAAGMSPSDDPRRVATTWRLLIVCVDVGLLALLIWQLRREGRSPWWAALYGWHPLVISEAANAGHQDVLGIALLLAAWISVTLPERRKRGQTTGSQLSVDGGAGSGCARLFEALEVSAGRVAVGAVLFTLAVGVKPVVLPLALPMVWWLRRRPVALAGAIAAVGLTACALYGPFAMMEGGLSRMVETGRTFVDKWAFNSAIHQPLVEQGVSHATVNLLMLASLVVLLAVLLWRKVEPFALAGVFLLVSLLLSSTCHPWYLLWALAFCALRFNSVTWLWSLTIGWSYVALINPAGYEVAGWVMGAEYLPLVMAAVCHLLWQIRRDDRAAVVGAS